MELSFQTQQMEESLITAFRYSEDLDEIARLEMDAELSGYARRNGISGEELEYIYDVAITGGFDNMIKAYEREGLLTPIERKDS